MELMNKFMGCAGLMDKNIIDTSGIGLFIYAQLVDVAISNDRNLWKFCGKMMK